MRTLTVIIAGLVMATAMTAVGEKPMQEITCDFDDSKGGLPKGWNVVEGDWKVADGALTVDAMMSEAFVTFGKKSWENYEVEVAATFQKVRTDSRWLAVAFRAAPDGSKPWSQFTVRFKTTEGNGTEFAVAQPEGGWSLRTRTEAEQDSVIGTPRKLKVVVRGERVECYLDGALVIDNFFCVERSAGCVGLGVSGCIASFDDFVVRLLPDTPKPTEKAEPKASEVVAHRGFSAKAPENTVVSARKAMEVGSDGSECDVRATKDGVIVLLHDDSVDRTTDGEGELAALTFEQVRALDAGSWKKPEFAGEKIPTLDELLQAHKGSGCMPVVEIKQEGISEQVVQAIRKAGMMEEAGIIAFSDTVVKEIRALAPSLPCAWLCGEDLSGKTGAERAEWIAERAKACNADMVDVHYGMLSRETVAELHQRGIAVWTWTVNDPAVMETLLRWGVDSITTDRPDVLLALRKDLTGK